MSKRNGKKDKPEKKLPSEISPEISLRVPEHGNGLLKSGNPGPWPGAGRTADIVKAIAREAFCVRIPRLARIADGDETIEEEYEVLSSEGPLKGSIKRKPNFGQQIKAHEVLAANSGLQDKDQGGMNLTVVIQGGGLGLIKIETGGNGHAAK